MTHIGNINPFRYRSYYYDTETKLYYLNSRYYNPLWGRFLNADGIIGANKDILGYNLYAYTSNNFVSSYDINGKFINTLSKTAWKFVVGILDRIGMKSSAEYLDRSLDETTFYSVTGDSYISNQIKNDFKFNQKLKEEIKKENVQNGSVRGDFQVTFDNWDLVGSLHTATIYYDGTIKNGKGDLNIRVYDEYDFKPELLGYLKSPLWFVLTIGNNLAWLDQFPGIIHNYDIYISFDYDVSL